MKKYLKWLLMLIVPILYWPFIYQLYANMYYLVSMAVYNDEQLCKIRISSLDIEESKKRGVFVRELNFKILSNSGNYLPMNVYIEKGFKMGCDSFMTTVEEKNTKYPYQLAFTYRPKDSVTLHLMEGQENKFDSNSYPCHCLIKPFLKDTVLLYILAPHNDSGIVKVW